jgi:hypothetical protein
MNKKSILYKGAIVATLFACMFSCDGVDSLIGGDDSETVTGLKSALKVGIDTAAHDLSQKDGYLADAAVKIGVPDEAATTFKAINYLSKNPLCKAALTAAGSNIDGTFEETLVTLFNRAAEDAAPKSVDVFVSAINKMSISDGETILFGANNAATTYLKTNTYTGLQAAFNPSITASLNTVKVANYTPISAWKEFATYNNKLADYITTYVTGNSLTAWTWSSALGDSKYNTVAAVKTVNTNLPDYVTGKALDGLFVKVAGKELDIRTNANARINDVLKKVFGRLDSSNSSSSSN